MGYYLNLRCSKCGHSFTGGYARTGVSSNLGLPVVFCPTCKTPNRTGKKIWSQMSSEERKQYVFSRVGQTLINAFPLFILSFIAIGKLFDSYLKNAGYEIFVWSGLIAILISSIISFINSRHIINKLERKFKEGDTESVTV